MRLWRDNHSIYLSRVESPEEIEMVRTIRNSFRNKDVYADNHLIEHDEHVKWFSSLDWDRDYLFLIRNGQVSESNADLTDVVGLVGCYQKKSLAGQAEVSIYIPPGSHPMTVSFEAMAVLVSFCFDQLHLEEIYAKFYKKDLKALQFNLSLGFKKTGEIDDFITTRLTSSQFRKSGCWLRRFL